MSTQPEKPPMSVKKLLEMKQAGEKIACLTAYDASFARMLDDCGVDLVLVGDTLGMVIQGNDTTLPVTVDDMVYHGKAVARGLQNALLVLDMPFMSDASVAAAVSTAGRFMQQAGAQMVKLEGGADQRELVEELTRLGIPVCAHLGLQPQRVYKLGGYRVQGRQQGQAERILEDARVLQQAGADMLLLECVPNELARQVTEQADVPVIGIGAGNACDGQILVLYDILGITPGRLPRFAHNFMQGAVDIPAAIRAYVQAVKSGEFPDSDHSFR